jgi:hypothetical protein
VGLCTGSFCSVLPLMPLLLAEFDEGHFIGPTLLDGAARLEGIGAVLRPGGGVGSSGSSLRASGD